MVHSLAHTHYQVEYMGVIVQERASVDVVIEFGLVRREHGLVEVALSNRQLVLPDQDFEGFSFTSSARSTFVLRSMHRPKISSCSAFNAIRPIPREP